MCSLRTTWLLALALLVPAVRAGDPAEDWKQIEALQKQFEESKPEQAGEIMGELFERAGDFLDKHLGTAPADQSEKAALMWMSFANRADGLELAEVEKRAAAIKEKLVPLNPTVERACAVAVAHRKVLPGTAAPGWKAKALDGQTELTLEGLKGKLVLLDFWATWCPPCIQLSKTRLAPMHEKHKDKLVVVGVGANLNNDSAEKQAKAAEKHKLHYPKVFDEGDAISKSYGVDNWPYVVLIDEQGKVLHAGQAADVMAEIEKTLGQRLGGDGK